MFHVILYEPEIPPNTGNIIRLCANTGASLSLVGRLGFELDEPRLRRAGLDYHEFARVARYPDLEACTAAVRLTRLWACSTRGETVSARPASSRGTPSCSVRRPGAWPLNSWRPCRRGSGCGSRCGRTTGA